MKKLGTPTAGAPGSDAEYVGFRALGTPRPVGIAVVRLAGVELGAGVGWRWPCRAACDRGRIARWVTRSERELVGRAADAELVDVRGAPCEDLVFVVPAGVVVERVVVVGVDRVVEVRVETVVVVGAGGPTAAVAGGFVVAVELVGPSDPEVEVEVGIEVVGGVVVVVGALVVVVGGLVVVVDVLVTVVVVVVVDELVVVVGVAPLPAHEFMSVTSARSIGAAAGPS